MRGLPIKYTSAPKFIFLNEDAGEEGSKQEEEQEDEYVDLYQKFNVPDLVGHERTYIKRFEQMGFWRKKFPVVKQEEKVKDINEEEEQKQSHQT